MYFDAVTIGALVDELSETLTGGRIQDSVQIDPESYGFEIYANRERHYLLLSAHQQFARVLLAGEKLRRGVQKPSPLGLLLRRYAEGARLEAVRQPPWERMIFFELDGPEGVFTLVAEPMERRANLLLVRDDGQIMDCVRRVGPEENRVRVSLPGHPYEPPPPQKLKRAPNTLTLTLLGDLLDNEPGEKTRQVLTRHLLGFSPLLAKEIVSRATGEINTRAADTSPRALLAAIGEAFDAFARGDWRPGVSVDEDGTVAAYAVYELTHLGGWEPTTSVSEALERFYGQVVGEGAYEAAKKPVATLIREARARVHKKLESLERQLSDDADVEQLKQSGELLLAYQYTIAPGQTELKAQYEVEGPELAIPIDPSLSPLENAQRYFEKYDKAKRSREAVPALIATTQQEIDYLDQLGTDLELATNWPEIGEVQAALQANGYWRGKPVGRPGGGQSAPLKIVTDDGFVIWVGRNARQNDQVTFDKGGSIDLWLHARGVPGAHVIVKSGGREVPQPVIERAASLAAYYSGARTETSAPVDVTLRKYVRKIKGGKPGMVTYRNESTLDVIPGAE